MGDDFRAAGDVFKVDDSLGLVFGWAIVCKEAGADYFDVQGDHIPEDAMLKAAADFMADHRVAKEMHAGDQVGQYVFAWPMTAEVAKAMGITTEKTGLMVCAKFSPGALAKFKDGTYTGFSIGGTRIKDEEVGDDYGKGGPGSGPRPGQGHSSGEPHGMTSDLKTRFGGMGQRVQEHLQGVPKEKLDLADRALQGREHADDVKLHGFVRRELEHRANRGL